MISETCCGTVEAQEAFGVSRGVIDLVRAASETIDRRLAEDAPPVSHL